MVPDEGAQAEATGQEQWQDRRHRDPFALLWEEPDTSKVGRPARVSRAEVVAAAVALADEQGLTKLSMRAVAKALGVGTMTLYSHVPGREELIDLMIETAYAEIDLPGADLDWRPALERYARGHWTMFRAHPWLLDINPWRMPLGPHVLAAQDVGARCLVDTGLSATQVVETIGVVDNSIIGAARSAAAEVDDERREGVGYEDYWTATSRFWEERFDPTRFPSMTRLWTVGAYDTAATPFDLRLDGLLDTIELLIDEARAKGTEAVPAFDDCMVLLEAKVEQYREQGWA